MYKITKGLMTISAVAGMSMLSVADASAIVQAPVSTAASPSAVVAMSDNLVVEKIGNIDDVNITNVCILSDETDEILNEQNFQVVKSLQEKHTERQEAQQAIAIKKACGVSVSDKERSILERIVEAEAGGEDHKGKILVANVVLNRVKSRKFPSDIESVVFAHSGGTYQFSPIYDGRYYTVTVSEDTRAAVTDALYGADYSQGALYFMERAIADSDNVTWFDRCLTRLFRYKCHEFYK